MATDNQHDVKVLNGLLSATLDTVQGYRDAAQATGDADHRHAFEARATAHDAVAETLRSAVVGLGGEPDQGGSILTKAKRAVMDVKHALMPDETSALGDAQGRETALLARFDKALDDTGISATTRETIRRTRTDVAQGHQAIGALKHSLEGQRDADSSLFPK